MKLLIEANENSVDLSGILWRRYVIGGNGAWLNLALNERNFLASSILEDMIERYFLLYDMIFIAKIVSWYSICLLLALLMHSLHQYKKNIFCIKKEK
jgi:hypothetical protein